MDTARESCQGCGAGAERVKDADVCVKEGPGSAMRRSAEAADAALAREPTRERAQPHAHVAGRPGNEWTHADETVQEKAKARQVHRLAVAAAEQNTDIIQ